MAPRDGYVPAIKRGPGPYLTGVTPEMAFVRKNPLKLNKLQLRTLVLAQVIAKDPASGKIDETTGEAAILRLPHAHGDHIHVGKFTVSARDASGFDNPAVWTALTRKGLVKEGYPASIVLTKEGLEYDTGLGDHFKDDSDADGCCTAPGCCS